MTDEKDEQISIKEKILWLWEVAKYVLWGWYHDR